MSLLSTISKKLNLSDNKKKVVSNVYWATLGKVINVLSSLFVGILVARYLGPRDFGLMNYVISYVTLFSVLAKFGLDNIEIRELAKEGSNKNEILGTAFSIRMFFALITIILVFITLLVFESDTFTFIMVMVYSLSLILNSLNVIRNYFTAIVYNEYVVKSEIARTLIGAAIKVLLLLIKAPLEWFIIAITFDFVLIDAGFIYSYRKKVGSLKEWKFKKTVAKYLVKESFPILLSAAAIVIYQRIDQIMIRNMIDEQALGQFAVAVKISEIGVFIPTVISQTIMPLLVKAHQESKTLYNIKRAKFMDIMVWGPFLLSLGLFLLAKPAVIVLFGEEYFDAIKVLQILSWKIFLVSIFIASSQLIVLEGIQKYHVFTSIGGCIISVVLNLILIPNYGIIGSSWTIIIAFIYTGYISNLTIRPYNFIFRLQSKSIIFGWRTFHLGFFIHKK